MPDRERNSRTSCAAGAAATEPVEIGRFNFRFECQPGCTNCCTRSGDVFLTEDDIGRIARHLGLKRAEFEKRYVSGSKWGPRLTIPKPHSCHFLLEGGCSIHSVKPLQCRLFPFWPEHVANRSAWKGLHRYCPGIGAGALVQIETVRDQAQAYLDAFANL